MAKVRVSLKDLIPGQMYFSNKNSRAKCIAHEKDGVRIKTDVKEIVLPYDRDGVKAYNLFKSVSGKETENPIPKEKTKMKIAAEQKVKFVGDANVLKHYNLSEGLANKEGVVTGIVAVPAFGGEQLTVKVDGKDVIVTNFQAKKCLVKVKKVRADSKIAASVKKAKKSIAAASKNLRADIKAKPGHDAAIVGVMIAKWETTIADLKKEITTK